MYNNTQYDNVFEVKHGVHHLLRFNAGIDLGRQTFAAQKTLVDLGASTNFMSKALSDRIVARGGKYKITDGGWMRVTAAGWQSERERRWRITVKIVIDKYYKEIEFTIFKGLEGTGIGLVLGKPWYRLHNKKHNIDHINNEIWITEDDGQTYHIVGLQPENEDCTARANKLGLHTITWQEARILCHRDKKLNFFLARGKRIALDKRDQGSVDLEGKMQQRFPIWFEEPTGVPPKRLFDMRIEIEPNGKIPYANPYRVIPLEDAELRRQLAVLQDNG
jgi:hypothetical protein